MGLEVVGLCGGGKEVAFRGDAAFARPEVYEAHQARQVKYAIRLPGGEALEARRAAPPTQAGHNHCSRRLFRAIVRSKWGNQNGNSG